MGDWNKENEISHILFGYERCELMESVVNERIEGGGS
jgi:hypothetical protein